ncbi:MAG: CPBP family intramembrane metalloprotease [Alphaproteobacteria bacterium]
MTSSFLRRHPLTGFYVIAYAFTWALGLPLLLSIRGVIGIDVPHLAEPVAAFGPFVAAIVVMRAVKGPNGVRELRQALFRWRVRSSWVAASLLGPVALLLIALSGTLFSDSVETVGTSGLGELWTITGLFELMVVGGLLQSLGEEPGWRGFAIPKLRQRFGPLLSTLALWPVWLGWHLPFFLSRPSFGWPQWIGFSVGILSAAIWLTLIRDRTQSVLMCVGWHAVANICRNTALAASSVAFLMYNNLILLSALIIAVYWIWNAQHGKSAEIPVNHHD